MLSYHWAPVWEFCVSETVASLSVHWNLHVLAHVCRDVVTVAVTKDQIINLHLSMLEILKALSDTSNFHHVV